MNQVKNKKVKIGVMGFVPPQVMNWDKANLEGKVKAKDIVETAKKNGAKNESRRCRCYRCTSAFRC